MQSLGALFRTFQCPSPNKTLQTGKGAWESRVSEIAEQVKMFAINQAGQPVINPPDLWVKG